MVFESLYESAKRNELLLIEGGMCQYHVRRDGQLTIQVIISLRKGAGKEMLEILKQKSNLLVARCPDDLESNGWYEKQGFLLTEQTESRTGREINTWTLWI